MCVLRQVRRLQEVSWRRGGEWRRAVGRAFSGVIRKGPSVDTACSWDLMLTRSSFLKGKRKQISSRRRSKVKTLWERASESAWCSQRPGRPGRRAERSVGRHWKQTGKQAKGGDTYFILLLRASIQNFYFHSFYGRGQSQLVKQCGKLPCADVTGHPGSQGQSCPSITPLWRPVRRLWSLGDQKWLGISWRFMVGGDGLGVGWKGRGGWHLWF